VHRNSPAGEQLTDNMFYKLVRGRYQGGLFSKGALWEPYNSKGPYKGRYATSQEELELGVTRALRKHIAWGPPGLGGPYS